MSKGIGPLRIAIDDWLLTSPFVPVWVKIGLSFIHDLEQDTASEFSRELEKIIPIEAMPAEYRALFNKALHPTKPGAIIALAGMLLGSIFGILIGGMQPISRIISYAVDTKIRSARIDPAGLVKLLLYNNVDRPRIMAQLNELGYRDEDIGLMLALAQSELSARDYISLKARGVIDDGQLGYNLSRLGFNTNDQHYANRLFEYIPGVQDLIHLAVKDTFNSETVRRFKLDEDYPSEITPFGLATGVSEQWLHKFWQSHWTMPGTNQFFEMFWRLRDKSDPDYFGIDDLMLALKTADIAPAFRSRLTKIAYQPYTRIDVRRMRELGVLTFNQVKESYLDLGYDDTRAGKLAEFVEKDIQDADKQLSKETILKAYRNRLYTREVTKNAIIAMGYSIDHAETLIQIIDIEIEKDLLNLALDRVEFGFIEGNYDVTQVHAELGKFGLSGEHLAFLIQQWELKRQKRIHIPTASELEELYTRDIIGLDVYKRELDKRGYSNELIGWNIRKIEIDQQLRAENEAEKARKEQERLKNAGGRKNYQLSRQNVVVQIRELELEVAELKVARTGLTDPSAIEGLVKKLGELAINKEKLQLQIAELQRDYLQI